MNSRPTFVRSIVETLEETTDDFRFRDIQFKCFFNSLVQD